jgi:hypothetical protein
MMATKTPTYGQLKQAFIDHGVRFKEMKNCSTIGRPWDSDNPLVGHVHHHTSTPSATGDTGCPTLEWVMTAFSKPAANAIIGRDGVVYVCSWGSCFHSGLGGPWKSRGLAEGNTGHYRLWGTEIDDAGTGKTITAAQIESIGRMDAAFMNVCGWDKYALVNHADWTDAGKWLMNPQGQPDGPTGKYDGRKNDTLRAYYSADMWRTNAAKYVLRPIAKPNVSLSRARKAALIDPKLAAGKTTYPYHVKLIEKALHAEGFLPLLYVDGAYGTRTVDAYKSWQKRLGYVGVTVTGIPDKDSLVKLGIKHGFRVVA